MEAVKDYREPNHSLFQSIPDAWVPDAEFMCLDCLSQFFAFYWQYLIGLGLAINRPPFSNDIDLKSLVAIAAYMGLWATVFRGKTCTWNDYLDQYFDFQVARYRVRPIPPGAVKISQAHFFTVALIAIGACILHPYGHSVLFHTAIDSVFLFIHPLPKRFTDFP